MAEEKILLVEDETDIRELVKLYLLNDHYRVCEADNGQTALQLLETEKPDLLILDILLPDLNGMDICREVRSRSDIPIIFLSCKIDSEDIIAGLELGGDDYVTKPFDPSILVTRVKANLRRYAMKGRAEQVDVVLHQKIDSAIAEQLTKRELDVLMLIEKGWTNQEIAAHFHISVGTIKGYNNQLFSKLEAKNRTQAILRARELGLLRDRVE